MQKYSLFQPIIKSFYSGDVYRDVGQNWRGAGLLYLFMILALCLLPIVHKTHQQAGLFIDEVLRPLIKEMPAVTIKDGIASIDQDSPYIIRSSQTDQPIIIFDTSGKISSLKDSKALALLTKDAFYMRGRQGINEYDFSGVKHFYLDRAKAEKYVKTLDSWWGVIIYPIVLFFAFVYRIVEIAIFALVGLFIAKSLQRNLRYIDILRLAAVALTPALIFNAVFVYTGYYVEHMSIIYLLIFMGYLYFAIYSNPKQQPDDKEKLGVIEG